MEEKEIISLKTTSAHIGLIFIFPGTIITAAAAIMYSHWWMKESLCSTVLFLGITIIMIGLLLLFAPPKERFFITSKRVYGKTITGKRVDIPIDTIASAELTNNLLSGISISTNVKKTTFYSVKNRSTAYEILNDIILKKHTDHTPTTKVESAVKPAPTMAYTAGTAPVTQPIPAPPQATPAVSAYPTQPAPVIRNAQSVRPAAPAQPPVYHSAAPTQNSAYWGATPAAQTPSAQSAPVYRGAQPAAHYPPVTPAPQPQPAPMNDYEKVKGLKELLDMGIITPEQFEKKKNEILGL